MPIKTQARAVRVRAATREDIPSIVEIATTSVLPGEDLGFGGGGLSLFQDATRLTAAWEEPNTVAGAGVFVADLDGRVVGCVTIEDRGPELELIDIDVPRELQGRGIGTGMVRFVEDLGTREGKRAVTLGTSRSAEGVAWKTLPWWLHLGYRITHEEENEWSRSIGPGAREIRMRKDLR
jgi:ribosomal protein S18 acetylase RimI-like enzyme